jgi:hypothetical protein
MVKRWTRGRDKAARPQDQQERTTLRKAIVVVFLTFLGGATLFVAWIAQHSFQAKWLEERLYLEKTQFLVEIKQSTVAMWQIQLNLEGARQPRNDELWLSAAYNFVQSVTTLRAWEESRVTDRSAAPIDVKNLAHDLAKKLFDKRDLDGLLRLATAIQTKTQYQTELDQKYSQQMAESLESADMWNGRFFWCYIVGSLLLAARWVLTDISGWPRALRGEHGP